MKKIYKIVIENKKLKMIKESNEKPVRPKSKQELVKIIKEFIDKNGKKANLNFIDTSLITDMSNIFSIPFCRFFNGDISEWDTSNVRNMSQMFKNSMFNGDISNWDVSNVEDMSSMFENSRFNGDISKWNISSVKYMDNMFAYSYFKQDISNWDISNVVDKKDMFLNINCKLSYCKESIETIQPSSKDELLDIIEQTIEEQGNNADLNFIDTSLISDMSFLFDSSDFNGDISNWDVSNVKYMSYMFLNSQFNGDISNWDVSNVENMEYMFYNSKFNGDISNWDVSNVENMDNMFCYSKFDKDIKVLTEDMLGKIMNIQLDLKQKKN